MEIQIKTKNVQRNYQKITGLLKGGNTSTASSVYPENTYQIK